MSCSCYTQVIINERTLCKGFFKRAIRVLVVLIDCEVVDPLSLRVVFKSQQPAKCAGFSARFRQLLSLLHESKYVEEMDPQPSTFRKTPATLKLNKKTLSLRVLLTSINVWSWLDNKMKVSKSMMQDQSNISRHFHNIS